jgi:hypothetical protein
MKRSQKLSWDLNLINGQAAKVDLNSSGQGK